MPVSSETGHPIGPGNLLVNKENLNWRNALNWSPDGNNLVFTLHEESSSDSELWTVSLNDGAAKQFTSSFYLAAFSDPVFSANGLKILYKRSDGTMNSAIKLGSISAGKAVTLLDSCSIDGRIDLSPDNRWILYNKKRTYNPVLCRLADKQQKELSSPDEVGNLVSWADQGSKAFFYKTSFDYQYLSKVGSIYGGPAFEFKNQSYLRPIGWSPSSDGLFVEGKDKDGNESLMIIRMSDQEETSIEGTTDHGSYASFSPDCSEVVVGLKGQMRPSDLYIMPVSLKESKTTGNRILLFKNFVGYSWEYAWSPDGTKIAIASGGEVWICDAKGGAPIKLPKAPQKARYPLWSPDGKSIAVGYFREDRMQILKSTDGEVIKTFENVADFDWTPDNREVIIVHVDGQLSAVSLTNGKTRTIANWKQLCSEIQFLKCSPDGKWIGINGYNEDIHFDIFKINAADGKATEVAPDDPYNKELMIWSTDSKWIAYDAYGSKKTNIAGTL